ncbi:regulator of chromosome condensation-like isoform X2 [Aricia agestis]|uniref:regulator of chromosome condensation-like isoform X2 n=1 Tax=Aricia agestis TaxID=91739 RepID=UPI001C2070C5|nr:regulator of chromosome condensation-like isoform X2 [Aricia agestis]
MPAARGVKRSASKASTSAAATEPKNKKKRGVIQLEIPSAPKRRGCVYTCGQGDVGQLGLGEDVMETTKFKQVTKLPNKIVEVIAGGMHTLALDSDGKVWSWGCNDEGALGRATSGDTEEGTPGQVSLPSPAVALSAGDSHSAALLSDGQVWAWGSFRDSHGSMGLVVQGREGKPCREPVPLPLPPAAALASGGDHLVVLDLSGNVYTMGCGEQGQLGRLTQRSASRGSRQGFGALLVPAKVTVKGGGVGVSAVWAGSHATFAVSGGKVLAWGLNNYGQLGITGEKRKTALFAPTECDALPADEWKCFSAGQHHTIALNAEGKVYAIGRCEYGRLGLGDRVGDAETPEIVPKLQNKKCVSISTGTSNSFAVTDTGEVYGWGMGSEGQLGTGKSNDENAPCPAVLAAVSGRVPIRVAAGGQHTVLLAEDPNAPKDPSPEPKKQKEDDKIEEEEEKEEKVETKKPRPNKRQKKQEQDEEISSTSSAQPSTDEPEKVNGDKKKETAMEVDETDSAKPEDKPENKEDKPTETQPDKPEPEQKSESENMDTSSQDTTDSEKPEDKDVEMKPEVNGMEQDSKPEKPDSKETKPEAIPSETVTA